MRPVAESLVAVARLGFRGTEQNTLGAGDAKPFHPLNRSAIMESVSGFSSCFPPRNLEGSRPRIRDRLHRIEHCALRTATQGCWPQGSSIALSRSQPRRYIFAEAEARSASAPRTPWSRCACRTGPDPHDSPTLQGEFRSLRPAFGWLSSAGAGTAARLTWSKTLRFKHMKEAWKKWKR